MVINISATLYYRGAPLQVFVSNDERIFLLIIYIRKPRLPTVLQNTCITMGREGGCGIEVLNSCL